MRLRRRRREKGYLEPRQRFLDGTPPDLFERALEEGTIPPPGWMWPNKFISADPPVWLPLLDGRDMSSDATWAAALGPRLRAFGGQRNLDELLALWDEYTAAVAWIVVTSTQESLRERPDLRARLEDLLLRNAHLSERAWSLSEPGADLFARFIRGCLKVRQNYLRTGLVYAVSGTNTWDPNQPDEVLAEVHQMVEDLVTTTSASDDRDWGIFDPRVELTNL